VDLVRQEEGYRGRAGATLTANHGTSVLLVRAGMDLSKEQPADCARSGYLERVSFGS
jgi:hypothetical protein